jgi:hypothetical protein
LKASRDRKQRAPRRRMESRGFSLHV